MDLVIIDYGMGNLHSAHKAVEKVAAGRKTVAISSDPEVIRKAERVILPGVGAMRDCMAEMTNTGLLPVIAECLQNKPFLGICVGFQALMQSSEENGGVDCLGLFAGRVRAFGPNLSHDGQRLKVPHMGWNTVAQRVPHPLWHNIADQSRFYFVHSYYVEAQNPRQVAGSCEYGVEFAAAIADGSRFAVQFHPEKSQSHGLQLLQNFVAWDGRW